MFDGFMLKFLGELFYLVVALCVLYGTWGLFCQYRRFHATVIRTHIVAYELQKLIQSRARQV